ncbi:uracil phosphoribosyltransferase [Candidatus Cryosericum odellii]|jgi:uracil phosphoribosyltransferase|uniref:Uracil phosphoribosyltransferase n=1 Tax=Candidatus Cryosericum odellii TaxID=2290917 RepID=A0A398D9R7_9BACT|nr:uracil phosphoribosyltransferase [Candidatus Cryosericum odellii]RIE09555.1 uracil phosphoribosyltransferase [Candidatus Cryosericum odellii]RIE11350.1 uracil phosphoribosyltransferase [Candidatus Cryosericum odellii]
MDYSNLQVLNHPLIRHKLTLLRNRNTTHKDFRELAEELAGLMTYEVCRNMRTKACPIETPLESYDGQELENEVTIVPVLRAGLVMAQGMLDMIPHAKVGHIGLFRDENTLEPVQYYCKLPESTPESDVFIMDPMLATGGSACKAISLVKERKPRSISFCCIIAAPEGIEVLRREHPDVKIVTLEIDRCLNENGYILPGLGDAGDRIYGTK